MSEDRNDSVVDILQRRLGTRHRSSMEQGRDDIERVLSEELSMERDQAHEMVSRLIDGGQIRYVTAAEQDPEVDRAAQYDEHTDRAYQVGDDSMAMGRSRLANPDEPRAMPIVPPGGGPQAGTAGMTTGAPVPAAPAASGSGAPGIPLVNVGGDSDAPDGRYGYWDIRGAKAGVVPSSTRKGQVEPKGT